MQIRLLGFVTFLVVMLACNKDKFQTKPTFTIKNINSTNIGPGETLIITMNYTDKEGDLADAKIGVQKIVPDCALSNFTDTNKYAISPDVPITRNQKGQIELNFPYPNINPFCAFDDTATFRLWLIDKGGHVSDTAQTGKILIRKS